MHMASSERISTDTYSRWGRDGSIVEDSVLRVIIMYLTAKTQGEWSLANNAKTLLESGACA